MPNKLVRLLTVIVAVGLIALAAWITQTDDDPCANPQADISASVLADGEENQDGLVNRAIIMKANCEEP
jgi:hypothetical protein